MPILRTIKRKSKAAVPPLLFLSLVGYFGSNAVNGDRGLKATVMRHQDLTTAQTELARAKADQLAWERRVAGLKSSHLDPDTLDERSRAMLNLAGPGDLVMPYAKDKRLF